MATEEFKTLLSPFQLGDITLKNRIVFGGHWTGYGLDHGFREKGLASERQANHYIERAKGGAGLLMVTQSVTPDGNMNNTMVRADDPRNRDVLSRMCDEIHKYDCKVFPQLNHGGHTNNSYSPQIIYAPTQMPAPNCFHNTKELELDEIHYIRDSFVLGSKMQKEWGFDGVEIKIAHDGLLRTFVSPYFNRREDEYGGTYENRLRIIKEIIEGIRSELGEGFPIGFRLCMDEFTEWGYGMQYGIRLAKSLEEYGATYVNTDSGTFSSYFMEIPTQHLPLGCMVYQAARLKKDEEFHLPVVAWGRINDPVQAETILADGNADLIAMVRQLICDPETPNKIMAGDVDGIRHCIGCMDGCVKNGNGLDAMSVHCVQNPVAGREKYWGMGTLTPAKTKKKVMVVGGGIAGLKAAEILLKRGHEVTVYEKTDKIGGQILLAEKVPSKVEMSEVYRYLKIQIERNKGRIVLNKEVDEAFVEAENPDVVIVATGSTALVDEVEGRDTAAVKIIDSRKAIQDPSILGDKVVLVDDIAYWQGIGVADYIASIGCNLSIVTKSDVTGSYLEGSQHYLVLQRLYRNDAEMLNHSRVVKVENRDVIVENVYNHKLKVLKDVDTLVYAMASSSVNDLYKKLKGTRSEVYHTGDCKSPRTIREAMFDAEQLARSI